MRIIDASGKKKIRRRKKMKPETAIAMEVLTA
jgi:hypothetical protein